MVILTMSQILNTFQLFRFDCPTALFPQPLELNKLWFEVDTKDVQMELEEYVCGLFLGPFFPLTVTSYASCSL